MNLNDLARECHEVSKSKGFYDTPPTFADRLVLMHSEISEALEEHRDGHGFTEIYYKDGKPEGIPIELADVIIRIMDMCGWFQIDIERAVREKIEYNKTRPQKHGRANL